uniref:MFS domain-containing protein n=1 Tax=Strongyloides stercoralis TaxID=6248 RepID=A0A0K0DUX3_STRER
MSFEFFGKTRLLILVLCTLCCSSILSNMNTYNFTKICKDKNSRGIIINGPSKYTDTEKAFFQSVVAIGALLASFPFTILFEKFPPKTVFTFSGIISCIATALAPAAHNNSFALFTIVRICQGMSFGSSFLMIGNVVHNWASLKENGVFIAILTACTQLSNVFTMPVSGAICDSNFGWPMVYYVHAAVCAFLFITFSIFFTDSPEDHNFVGFNELTKIQDNKIVSETKVKTPYLSILKDKTVWGIWIAAFADLLAVQLVSMSFPTYMDKTLHYDVKNTGLKNGLAIFFQFLVKLISGLGSDKWTSKSELFKVRFFDSLALGISGFLFIFIGFIPIDWKMVTLIYSIVNVCILGCNAAAFNKCATLYSRQFSKFVVGHIMTLWAITILIEPFIVALFNHNNTLEEWRYVFWFHAIVLVVANFIFCYWAKTDPAPWTIDKTLPTIQTPEEGNKKEEEEEKQKYEETILSKNNECTEVKESK